MRLTWPLTGRSAEMRSIETALSASDAHGVVVRGPAGVGKSRVARESLSTAESRGHDCRWVVGTSSARAVPLGAFTAWAPPGVTGTVQLLRAVIDSLTTTSSDRGVVVAVDDAHLLDDLSAFVVHQIVERSAAKVILTVVDGAPVPAAVSEIWKAGQLDRLDLQPLSPDETAALLSTTLAGPVDSEATQRLWRLTRGNVLYLRTIVEREVTDGRLVQQHGHWRWIGDPVMPPSLVELIESRIGVLPSAVGDVVDTVAVGEPIDLTSLRRIADPDAVEEADARGLITLTPAGRGVEVRLAHPLYGEIRRRRAPATRLRRLRGQVATELAASKEGDDMHVVVRRATLCMESDLNPDADLLLRAAHGAVWLADLSLADRLATAASHAGAGSEADLIRAHALSWLGRGEAADAVLEQIDAGSLPDDERARLAFHRASNLLWALGAPSRAKHVIDEARSSTPPHARRYLDAFLTVYWFAMDQPDAAKRASKDLTVADLPPVVAAETAWVLAVIAGDAGRTADAIATADAGYDLAARSLDAPHMTFNIADAHVSALWLSGRIRDALEVAERVRRQSAELPGTARSLGAAVAGRAAFTAGRLDTARVLLADAVDGLSATHAIGWGYSYEITRIIALAISGAATEAAAALAALDERPRYFRWLDYEKSLARAWVVASQGSTSEAVTVLLAAAKRAAALGRFAAEAMCLQTATQLGDRTSEPRLAELQSLVEGPRVRLAAEFSRAMRDGDPSALFAVSAQFEDMGDAVAAVDAAAHAARMYRKNNLRGSALTCAARADALAEQYGVGCTPALRQAAEPLPLTDRESEIVMMIGEGWSNPEIAERLTLSPRTVESHIYRAMKKTGTGSREELAGLLPRHGAHRQTIKSASR